MTTTTSPCFANVSPWYQGVSPEPKMNAPPWIHTITGRRASSHPGVQTLRYSASSLTLSSAPAPKSVCIADAACAQMGEKRVASRTPSHASSRWGGSHRREPMGGAAYGMPLNTNTPSLSVPSILPLRVCAIVMSREVTACCHRPGRRPGPPRSRCPRPSWRRRRRLPAPGRREWRRSGPRSRPAWCP